MGLAVLGDEGQATYACQGRMAVAEPSYSNSFTVLRKL